MIVRILLLRKNLSSRTAFLELVIAASPFGQMAALPWPMTVLKFVDLVGKDFLQILVASQTIGFVGRVNPLWALKLALSLFSASYSVSKTFTNFVFGHKVSRAANLSLQAVYFMLVGLAFSLACTFLIQDNFCDLTRTVNTLAELTEEGECTSINQIIISGFQSDASSAIQASSIGYSIEITNNTNAITLTFTELVDLNATIDASDNSGSISVFLPALSNLDIEGNVVVADNPNLVTFEFTSLLQTAGTAVITVTNNGDLGSVLFPVLGTHQGTLVVSDNSFANFSLPLLSVNSGKVLISNNPGLVSLGLPTLFQNNGAVEVFGNPELLSLNLTMLYSCFGSIAVTFNSALQAFSVPFFSHNSLNLNISFNPVLTEVDFPRMLYFSGAITVSQNPELAVLHFDAFGY